MIIKPAKKLCGTVTVPGDKSISHRAVMFASIAQGITHISGFLCGEDCLSTVSCFRKMGVRIDVDGTDVTIYGNGINGLKPPKETLDVGNSGTTARIMCGLLSAQPFDCVIDGDFSIRKRPMKRVTEPLSLMGADIKTTDGCCPLNVKGSALTGKDITINVASAQLKSAILMAGLYAEGKTSVTEPTLSRNHTELMLKAFGADITTEGTTVTVSKANSLKAKDINVPSDISSAAFFMVAATIIPGSHITIKNVGINPTRTGIVDALKLMGADITYENYNDDVEPTADIVVRYAPLHSAEIGGDIIPRLIDEIPILAVAALFADGKTVIKDAHELRVKETDRIAVIAEEFAKCGAHVECTDDGMSIQGHQTLHAAVFDSHGDHRIAMSCGVLALALDGDSEITNAEAAAVSYPDFFNDLETLK
ncbi:MAG: 3-phosphoshikimate 1-carboxyvinyltransferase [Clostridia bacterium]|nr:3-phosphoshikimate 1-carboxyvinyltransferase [Clostridia bacterium]